jgi:hypothetical protein
MNVELIKDLAEQSGLNDLTITITVKKGEEIKSQECTQIDFEKFVELIVLECCAALSPMLRDMISRGKGVELIKQRFGVEK